MTKNHAQQVDLILRKVVVTFEETCQRLVREIEAVPGDGDYVPSDVLLAMLEEAMQARSDAKEGAKALRQAARGQ